jgi:hypothetical protein
MRRVPLQIRVLTAKKKNIKLTPNKNSTKESYPSPSKSKLIKRLNRKKHLGLLKHGLLAMDVKKP